MIVEFDAQHEMLSRFLALPERIYGDDPNYCPPPPDSLRERLLAPGVQSEQKLFVALDGGDCVARIVARRCPNLIDAGTLPGTLGFFESINNENVTRALLAQACNWLQASGCDQIYGPIDGTIWGRYRLNVGPFEERPFLLEPYNPPYYARLWESAGMEKLQGYFSKRLAELELAAGSLESSSKRAQSAGYRIRRLKITAFEAELRIIYDLSIKVFRENFLYQKISWEAFALLYSPLRPMLDPDFVWFAIGPDGVPVGFVFGIADLNQEVVAMRRSGRIPTESEWLTYRDKATTVNVKSLGVLRKDRRSGVGGALVSRMYQSALEKGYTAANLCLISDGNSSGELDGGAGTIMRRYHLYRHQIK